MITSYEKLWDMPLGSKRATSSAEEQPQKRVSHVVGNVIYGAVQLAAKVAFRYNTVGLEHLRRFAGKGGCVVVSNHASFLDPMFLWIAARPQQWIRFMARDNLFTNMNGFAGWVISRVGAFPVKRVSADRAAIKRAAAMLKRGEVVGIFPEGTRRGKSDTTPELHSGAAFIARMGKAPLVPSATRNAASVKKKGERVRFPKVTVVFGEPVYLEDFDFLPKEDRLDAASWYAMRECYALLRDVAREQVDMHALFPEAKDYTEALAAYEPSRKGNE